MELHKRYSWQNLDNGRYYYEAWASTDLFGDWEIIKIWGRCGTALGRLVNVPVESSEAVQRALLRVARARQRHGYV
jgi:predicted DNA-binding WGR domain protein